MKYIENEFFLLALTFAVYYLASLLHKKSGWIILNPILITIAVIITFLKLFGVTLESYNSGGKYIEFWLKPAIVALGVPLYLQLETIRKQFVPIFLSQLAGCIVGIISVVSISKAMGATKEVILSLAPKSVTTPIAIEVSNSIGGIPSLTAAVVIFVGILGAVIGYKTMSIVHVRGTVSQGLSMGAAAHAVGTSASMSISKEHGAYATLGLILNGILTSFFTPVILHLMGIL
ncbi:MAG: LrgB family protein [Bacteroidales bacterium]